MRASDISFGVNTVEAVDRAIEASAENIDGMLQRRFYNVLETKLWDWPNFQYAYPWRIWFGISELADVTGTVPVVTSGGTVIPNSAIFWGDPNLSPPYTYMELDRSQNYSFGGGSTPQRDVSILGLFGYWNRTKSGGTLAAAVTDTTSTTLIVSNSATPGVGDVIIVDSERMLVQDRSWITTSQTQQGTGCTTGSAADNALTVTDGTKFSVGETLLLDQERMYVYQISGNILTVKRGVDGTVLDTHSGATVYAARQLTVTRGDYGTTAATHSNAAAIDVQIIPFLVRDLSLAESQVQVYEEIGGYADPQGEGAARIAGIGAALPDKWEEAQVKYGRQVRIAVI